jgi:hypothetical protein
MNTNHGPSGGPSREALPGQIARLLTRAAQQLDGDTVSALRRARQRALERQTVRRSVFALDAGHNLHLPIPHTSLQWLAAAMMLAVLAGGIGYWHHAGEHESSHLDLAILTDDLPMEVFIDR